MNARFFYPGQGARVRDAAEPERRCALHGCRVYVARYNPSDDTVDVAFRAADAVEGAWDHNVAARLIVTDDEL